MNMDFVATKTRVEVIKKDAFGGTYFILVLMVNGIESHGKNLIRWEILIRSIIGQIIKMLVLINIVLNVEHH